MKFFLVTLMAIFTFLCTIAQTLQDVIYLKNGGITRGTIMELIPDKTVKIETVDRNVFVYQMSEVEKIAKEQTLASSNQQQNSSTNSNEALQVETGKSFLNSQFLKQSGNSISVRTFTKTNGVQREVHGQKIYQLEYKAIAEFMNNGWVCGNPFTHYLFEDLHVDTKKPEIGIYGEGYNSFGEECKYFQKGQQIEFTGSVTLESTDNGLRGSNFVYKSYKELGINTNSIEVPTSGSTTSTSSSKSYPETKYWLYYSARYGLGDSEVVIKSEPASSYEENFITTKLLEVIENTDRFSRQSSSFSGSSSPPNSMEINFDVKNVQLKTSTMTSSGTTTKYYLYAYQAVFIVKNLLTNTFRTYAFEYNASNSLIAKSTTQAALESAPGFASYFINNLIYEAFPLQVSISSISDENNKGEATKVIVNGASRKVKFVKFSVIKFDEKGQIIEIGTIRLSDPETGLCKVLSGGDIIKREINAGTKLIANSFGVEKSL